MHFGYSAYILSSVLSLLQRCFGCSTVSQHASPSPKTGSLLLGLRLCQLRLGHLPQLLRQLHVLHPLDGLNDLAVVQVCTCTVQSECPC